MARPTDPHHPLGDHLPQRPSREVLASSKAAQMGLLKRAEMNRHWKVALARVVAHPPLAVNALGQAALAGIAARVAARPSYMLTYKEQRVIANMDDHQPCCVQACAALATFRFKALGYCRAHEAAYWHQRRVWDQYRDVHDRTGSRADVYIAADKAAMDHQRAVRARYRRKSRRK